MSIIKITINDKTYILDIEKALDSGVLKERKGLLLTRNKGQLYYYIDELKHIKRENDFLSDYDSSLYSNGNYFESKEVAEYFLKHDIHITPINNYIVHRNIDIDYEPDWGDSNQTKYCIVYDSYEKKYVGQITALYNLLGMAYTTKEVASEVLEILNNEIKEG